MSKVVDIKTYHLNRALQLGLPAWQAKFKDPLKLETRLADLSDQTLLTLAQLQGDKALLLQGLIMGFLGLGPAAKFHFLEGRTKLEVLDAFFFMADQIRWECMRRLGWVHDFAGETFPLVELILNHRTIKQDFTPRYPQLDESHPEYNQFVQRRPLEAEVVVRRLIPSAIALLERKVSR
jgi:hypothetical protein